MERDLVQLKKTRKELIVQVNFEEEGPKEIKTRKSSYDSDDWHKLELKADRQARIEMDPKNCTNKAVRVKVISKEGYELLLTDLEDCYHENLSLK